VGPHRGRRKRDLEVFGVAPSPLTPLLQGERGVPDFACVQSRTLLLILHFALCILHFAFSLSVCEPKPRHAKALTYEGVCYQLTEGVKNGTQDAKSKITEPGPLRKTADPRVGRVPNSGGFGYDDDRDARNPRDGGIVPMYGLVITLAVFAAIVLLLILVVIGMYNKLIVLRNRFKNAFAQIDVQLKRRYDLIPNLVEVAKGYIKHERETLEAVTQARNLAAAAGKQAAQNPGDPSAMQSLNSAEGQLTGALGRLMVVMEAYPDLKANQNMLSLQEELSSTENKIAFSRQAYNDAVMGYNTGREVFPTVIIASMFNFTAADLFEVKGEAEREAPKVSFS